MAQVSNKMTVDGPTRCSTRTSHQLLPVSNTSDVAPSAPLPHRMHMANLTQVVQTSKAAGIHAVQHHPGGPRLLPASASEASLCTAGAAAVCSAAAAARALEVDSGAPAIRSSEQGAPPSTASLPCGVAPPVAAEERETGDADKVSA